MPNQSPILQKLYKLQSDIQNNFSEAKGFVKASIEEIKVLLEKTIKNCEKTSYFSQQFEELVIFLNELGAILIRFGASAPSILTGNSIKENSAYLLLLSNTVKDFREGMEKFEVYAAKKDGGNLRPK